MRRTLLLALALLLPACNRDRDDDGFKEKQDCDDEDPAINPDASETCDDVDNNCDGEVDEGLRNPWYADGDGDTWGDPDSELLTCARPEGFVDNNLDCDDSTDLFHPGAQETDCADPADYNCDGSVGYADLDEDGLPACEDCDDSAATTFPGADEVCDGLDNDCNGDIDEEPVDGGTYFLDYDLDGYGGALFPTVACASPDPALFVENDDDCNDYSDQAFPGGAEVCDGLDNDCNGFIDVADAGVLDAGLYYPDSDGDGYGDAALLQLACEGLDGFIEEGGDCDDSTADVNPDQIEVCNNGLDDDCDPADLCELTLDLAGHAFVGADPDDRAGNDMAGLGDVNGDGIDDLIIGADLADVDADGNTEGAAYIFFGPIATDGSETSMADADIVIEGADPLDQAGLVVGTLGDINGDNVNDIVVTASQHSGSPVTTRSKNGKVYVFYGGADLEARGINHVDDADLIFYGDRNFDWFGGSAIPLGDMNADGLDDFIIGASGDDDGGAQSGGYNLFFSQPTWTSGSLIAATSATALISGAGANDRVGLDGVGIGDMNGDGVPDVALGLQYLTGTAVNSGAVTVGFGPLASGSYTVTALDLQLNGSSSNDWAGAFVAEAGDVNADGYADLWVAATQDNTPGGSGSGSVYLVFGGADPVTALDGQGLDDINGARIYGDRSNDGIGNALDGAHDLDGDGFLDLLIGASGAGDRGEGAAYVVYGPFSGAETVSTVARGVLRGEALDDGAGNAIGFVGDLGGLGSPTIGVAAQFANRGGSDAGAAYLLFQVQPN
ncbi:MAG: hypothetical protein RL071_2925 [Pseudomonadota bacterium]